MTIKSTNRILLLFLGSFFCSCTSAQFLNKHTYGDYEFEEIRTAFPISTFVKGFVDDVAIARDKDENSFLVDTLGNQINLVGFRSFNFDNRGNYFVVADIQGKAGVINSKGKLVVPYLYKSIKSTKWEIEGTQVFQYGLCMVQDFNKKIGFVNTTGKVIIPIIYSDISDLEWSEGYHVVQLNGLQGIIDTLGKIIIPIRYIKLTPMKYGHTLALDIHRNVQLLSKTGVMKNTPYIDFHEIFSHFGGFTDGLAGVKNRLGLWGFINTDGKEIVKCKYDAITDFSEGIARVGKLIKKGECNLIWGCVNIKGKLITPIKYQQIDEFENGIARVRMVAPNENFLYYHFINADGKEINNQKYRTADRMRYGVARVRNNSWYIDYKENKKPKPDFCTCEGRDVFLKKAGEEIDIDKDYCIRSLWFSDGLMTISDRNSKVGFIDTTGNVVVPCSYKYAYEFNNNYAWVEKYNDTNWYILKKTKIN